MNRSEGKGFCLQALMLAVASAFAAGPVHAQEEGGGGGGGGEEGGGGLFGWGIQTGGFVRLEGAFRTDPDENPNNLRGNPFNGKAQPRAGGLPLGGSALSGPLTGPLGDVLSTITLPGGGSANDLALFQDSATRSTRRSDNDWNLQQLRGKFDLQVQFSSEFQLYASLRTIYDLGNYDDYDPDSINSNAVGFNQRRTEYFEYDDFSDGGCLGYTEVCGENYMADFTSLYLDYQNGPVLIRVGQQQIAWGQALFFRVFDVPNGLDLRRHLILDDALEEYADERVAAPGVRVTWQATDQWEVDGYAQLFQQTTYPNPNTPYNVIPAQFSVHETFSDKHRGEDFNYGLRLRSNFGNWGLQFIATQRWNHEGVFRWTQSNVNRDVPGIVGSGLIVQQTPLEVDPSGVWSAAEWFTYAGQVRLDGVEGLNDLINDFPFRDPITGTLIPGVTAASLLGAQTVSNEAEATRELDLFFALAGGKLLNPTGAGGGLRGHIIHEYFKEEVYGAGISYVVEAEPGSILDQLIINVETSYIPDRVFTDQGLGRVYDKKDESVTDLVMEKYHRWFEDFPATYMVFQAIHKTQSNLFGQGLGCQGGTGGSPGSASGEGNKRCSKQSGGSSDVVLAFLQPFPNYIYRLSGAALLDVDGGLLVQGGFRWSPGNDLTFDFIYNYVDGRLYGDKNSNALENIEWADEFVVRAGYQF